jgi:hypothetical protein
MRGVAVLGPEGTTVVRSDTMKTTVAQVLLGLASSLVIVGAFTPLAPLGPRSRRSIG